MMLSARCRQVRDRSRAFRPLLAAALAACALVLPACDETDAAAVRIRLEPAFSGTVMTSSVVRLTEPGPLERASSGATWETRGALVTARGRFDDLATLKLADLSFEYGGAGGDPFVKVTLPRGRDARWPAAFTVPQADERDQAARAIDPETDTPTKIGATVKIVLDVPGRVISAGVRGKARGLSSNFEETNATLIVPADLAFTEGEPLVWHVTWSGR